MRLLNSDLSPEQSVSKHLETCTKILETKSFDLFLKGDLNFLLMLASGYFGENNHEKACKLLDTYYNWYLGKTYGIWNYFYGYRPCGSGLPSPKNLIILINDAKDFYNKHAELPQNELQHLFSQSGYSDYLYYTDYRLLERFYLNYLIYGRELLFGFVIGFLGGGLGVSLLIILKNLIYN